ncbi:MAG: ATP-binding protein [Gracilibacteraceae bacterium]|jgi:DNA replication protein DnaC|nr:ATP-binding protein [Gracilibacteraceae bacterium]
MADYGKTHAEQSADCPLCGGRGVVLRGDEAVSCECMTQKKADQAFRQAGLPKAMRQCRFDNFRFDFYTGEHLTRARKAFQEARDFAGRVMIDPAAVGLMLTGDVGTGKTFLAACIANEIIAQSGRVLFLIVPDLLDQLRASFDGDSQTREREIMDQARSVPVLILDDLGAHNYTEWVSGRIYTILNYRLNEQLPTVVTTNLTLPDIEDCLGNRAVSRLVLLCRQFRLTAARDIRHLLHKERELGGESA